MGGNGDNCMEYGDNSCIIYVILRYKWSKTILALGL
jgi:hypothetical protein